MGVAIFFMLTNPGDGTEFSTEFLIIPTVQNCKRLQTND
jgi:hypothetical protein